MGRAGTPNRPSGRCLIHHAPDPGTSNPAHNTQPTERYRAHRSEQIRQSAQALPLSGKGVGFSTGQTVAVLVLESRSAGAPFVPSDLRGGVAALSRQL